MQSMLTLWSEMLFWQCAFGYIPSQPPQQQIIGPAHYQDRGVDPIKHIYWQTKHLICTCAFKCVAFRTLLVTLVKVHLCFVIMILGNRFYYLAQHEHRKGYQKTANNSAIFEKARILE